MRASRCFRRLAPCGTSRRIPAAAIEARESSRSDGGWTPGQHAHEREAAKAVNGSALSEPLTPPVIPSRVVLGPSDTEEAVSSLPSGWKSVGQWTAYAAVVFVMMVVGYFATVAPVGSAPESRVFRRQTSRRLHRCSRNLRRSTRCRPHLRRVLRDLNRASQSPRCRAFRIVHLSVAIRLGARSVVVPSPSPSQRSAACVASRPRLLGPKSVGQTARP